MENREKVEMKHSYHFHPLILFEEEDFEGIFCSGCQQPILPPFYACTCCLFFLHKFCAELPNEITHFCHPKHRLQLRFESWKAYEECEVCGAEVGQKFHYYCHSCRFVIDMKCASMVLKFQQVIEQANHTHNLVSIDRSAMFLCNACNTEHGGNSFLCTECGFWANQECVSSSTTIKLRAHDHSLTRLQCIPESSYTFRRAYVIFPNCEICSQEIKRNQWIYFCSECKYFVHMRCSASKIEHFSDSKAESKHKKLIDANVMELPWTNIDSAVDDLIAQLIQRISSQAKKSTDDDVVNRQMIISTPNYIHQHRLIFSESLQIDHRGEPSSSSITIASKQSENKLCNGCGYTILNRMPFYYCAEAECNNNFFLHQWCATLPNEVEHLCHPQHKLLLITPQSPNFTPRKCTCCEIYCNKFFFGCVDCGFYMDVKCAGLPTGIRHKSHDKHILILRRGWGCKTCGGYVGYYSFICEVCHLKVCIQCALLPRYVEHRYDKHPFTLTYSLPNGKDKDHHAVYYCEICEDDIKSNRWFYHCNNCDQSLHVRCVIPDFKG